MHWQAVEPRLQAFITQEQLPDDFFALVKQWYWPLAQQLAQQRQAIRVLGINGAQGTGKSTLAQLLKILLEAGAGMHTAVLSIDDFYLTLQQRETLARSVHPLLKVRGVPGTHDVAMALELMEALLSAPVKKEIALPRFNKAADDRMPAKNWPTVEAPVDLIILEGWCVGIKPQTEQALAVAANQLEREQDTDGRWRDYVNQQLAGDYQQLFALLDGLVMLKAPSMEVIAEWRWLQEQKLIAASGHQGEGLMNEQQVQLFIQYYERLTRHGLKELPVSAELVYQLGSDHRIQSVTGPWSQAFAL